jgi:hypothetical protein
VRKRQLDRGEREFVAQFRIGAAQFLGDAAERGVHGETRLGADHQQVERIGQTLADRGGTLGNEVGR